MHCRVAFPTVTTRLLPLRIHKHNSFRLIFCASVRGVTWFLDKVLGDFFRGIFEWRYTIAFHRHSLDGATNHSQKNEPSQCAVQLSCDLIY